MSQSIVLVGAGGHAMSVISALHGNNVHIAGYVDSNPHTAHDIEHLGDDESYLENPLSDLPHICAVGDNAIRQKLQRRYEEKGIRFGNVIHPAAVVEKSAHLGSGIFIGAFAYVNGGCRIGDGAIINNHANVDHDCHIGEFSHLAPNSCLTGTISVGEGSLIGAGATVIPGLSIGKKAIVGAGSVVLKDVGDGVTVVGSPARVVDGG